MIKPVQPRKEGEEKKVSWKSLRKKFLSIKTYVKVVEIVEYNQIVFLLHRLKLNMEEKDKLTNLLVTKITHV